MLIRLVTPKAATTLEVLDVLHRFDITAGLAR